MDVDAFQAEQKHQETLARGDGVDMLRFCNKGIAAQKAAVYNHAPACARYGKPAVPKYLYKISDDIAKHQDARDICRRGRQADCRKIDAQVNALVQLCAEFFAEYRTGPADKRCENQQPCNGVRPRGGHYENAQERAFV